MSRFAHLVEPLLRRLYALLHLLIQPAQLLFLLSELLERVSEPTIGSDMKMIPCEQRMIASQVSMIPPDQQMVALPVSMIPPVLQTIASQVSMAPPDQQMIASQVSMTPLVQETIASHVSMAPPVREMIDGLEQASTDSVRLFRRDVVSPRNVRAIGGESTEQPRVLEGERSALPAGWAHRAGLGCRRGAG